jgi:hypothetical protein
MEVTEVGSEVDVGMMQTKETNKGGAFKDKFKRSGKTAPTPIQLWTDKYRPLLKSNGWGGAGKKWSKNWGEREEATLELERILGRSYLTQLVAKKSDVVEGESVTAVTVGESEGCAHMGHTMEDEEMEEREEDEESVGEEEGEGEWGGEGNEEEVEGGGAEEVEVGEGGDDEDYEREAPPPSDKDGCDWDGLSASFMT